MSEERAKNLRFKLGFDNAISSEGLSGGLVLMWKKGIIVREQTKNNSHIDVTVFRRTWEKNGDLQAFMANHEVKKGKNHGICFNF